MRSVRKSTTLFTNNDGKEIKGQMIIILSLHLLTMITDLLADQIGCTSLEWKCKDGQCISSDEKCDGILNCSDRSDETSEFCADGNCPAYAFRCAYGACVSGKSRCNGIKECADNSDESPLLCGNSTDRIISGSCSENSFQCSSGECINSELACDGRNSCTDGSDETTKLCAFANCPVFAFKCHYGACVNGKAKCNGIEDCMDGSDESPETCGVKQYPSPNPTTTSRPVTKPPTHEVIGTPASTSPDNGGNRNGCILRISPNMEVRAAYDVSIKLKDGDLIKHLSSVIYKCKPTYVLFGGTNNLCYNGQWNPTNSECSKTCNGAILKGVTFNVVGCQFKQIGVSCSSPIRAGTRVTLSCAIGYQEPDRPIPSTINCRSTGEWDYSPVQFSCLPICGTEALKVTPFAAGGEQTNISRVPWHSAIYMRHRNDASGYKQICGGTIISAKLIVTAAHCFKRTYDITNYAVVVGKTYREYNASDEEIQRFSVSEIHVPEDYLGPENFYYNDIAIVVLNDFILYRDHIKPICVKWLKYRDIDIPAGTTGLIAGWGRVSRDGDFSNVLMSIELPVISRNECIRKVSETYKTSVTSEKFCVGSPLGEGAVCQGDSGGGFAVPQDINGVKTFFLWGVVSTSLSMELCGTDYFVTFTNIQHHQNMLIDYESRFRPN